MYLQHDRLDTWGPQPRGNLAALATAMALAWLPAGGGATSICRWVDENGRSQISDVVPQRFKHIASCIDSRQYELSPEQRREADQRAADERSRARRAAASAPTNPAPAAARATAAAPRPPVKQPAEVVTDATDCPTWWRLYDESSACFGPHRTTRGAVKPEAFDLCNVVPSPEPKCGLRRN